jgi:hypothetical protein
MQKRHHLHRTLLFLKFFIACFSCSGQAVTGHLLIRTTGDSSLIRENNMVWLGVHDGKWRISGLDSNFNFSFDPLPDGPLPDTTEIRITTLGKYKDTTVTNVIIANNKTTHLEILYPPYCEYDKSKNDSICPVCNKHDQVDRITYEPYPNPPKGKRKRSKYWGEHHFTTGCDPHWYCRRDDKKF